MKDSMTEEQWDSEVKTKDSKTEGQWEPAGVARAVGLVGPDHFSAKVQSYFTPLIIILLTTMLWSALLFCTIISNFGMC